MPRPQDRNRSRYLPPRPGARLSPREREVLILIAEGRRNRDIAQLWQRSEKTVQTHRASMYKKIGVHSVGEAVRYAFRHGLVRP